MPDPKPLFVRLASDDAARLDAAVSATGKTKRQLVTEAVRDHLTDDRLTVGRVTLREAANEVMTLPEAAAFLRLDEQQLEACVVDGEVPARRIAGEWRFSRAALLVWLGGGAGG